MYSPKIRDMSRICVLINYVQHHTESHNNRTKTRKKKTTNWKVEHKIILSCVHYCLCRKSQGLYKHTLRTSKNGGCGTK